MRTTLILLAVTSFLNLPATLAQKRIQVYLYSDGDTSLAYTWTKRDSKKVGLLDLTTTQQALHFRLWSSHQVVDIWSTDKQRFVGNLISYTSLYHPPKKGQTDQAELFYQDLKSIDPTTAQQIYESARSRSIFSIPDQNSISGWSLGTDGYSVSIEYATPTDYSFKHYWGPRYQGHLREAKVIDSFYAYLESTLRMSEVWTQFINRLPKGCYETGTLKLSCNEQKR